MRNVIIIMAMLLAGHELSAQAVLTPDQLKLLEGTWTGDMLVTDPKSQAQRSLKTEFTFTAAGVRSWLAGDGFASSPGSSRRRNWSLSADGRTCDGQDVERVEQLAPDSVRFTLVREMNDSAPPLRVRMVYVIGPKTCTIRKEVMDPTDAGKGDATYTVRQEQRLRR